MVSLSQLQKENNRLKMMQKKLDEARKNNEDRKKLLKENKKLSRNLKFGKEIIAGKKVGRVASQVGKATGRGLFRVGKAAFNGLNRYARFLDEQERKQRIVNSKLKSSVKRKKTWRK